MQTYGSRAFDRKYVLEAEVLESYKKLISRQYLANGITTIFDMGQPEPWLATSIKLQNNPSPEFPNLFINGSSTISDPGPNGFLPLHHEPVANAEAGREKVRKYAKLGIKHMKLYSRLKEDDMKPIVDEATKYGITLNAHVDNNVVTIPQAMNLGVRNFEHFFTLTPSILTFDKHYPLLDKKYGLERRGNIDTFAAKMVYYFGYIKDNPELDAKLNNLFEQMAAKDVTISTALNVLATAAERSYTFSTFEFLPPRNTPMTNYSKTQKEQLSKAFDAMMHYMKTAHEKGVKIRIGTDTRYGNKAFFSELMLFIEAGFPIEDVLQIATINGAEAMKVADKFGSIEEGKKADLVIFDKSPIEDYKNLNSQKTVIKGGKLFELRDSLAYVLKDRIERDGFESANKWLKKNRKSKKHDALDEAELNEIAYQLFAMGKIKDGIAIDKLKKQEFPTSGKVYNALNENNLNNFGYHLLQNGKANDAIAIFALNVDTFPNSANAYDSLGEAYLASKNNKLALANYKKAVELNPNNFNAVNVINELEGRQIKVADTILESYVGEYELRANLTFNISTEDGKLFWQQVGQSNKLELTAISNKRFVFAGSNQSVLFETDSNGNAIGMKLDQNGRESNLTKIKSTMSEEDAVRIPLNNYLEGHKTRKAEYMKKAFHTEGKLIFIRDGKYTKWDFQDYISRFVSGNIAADEDQRTRKIESIDIAGNAAMAKLVLDYPTTRFVDYVSLLKINGEWKIVSKVFYAEPKIKS